MVTPGNIREAVEHKQASFFPLELVLYSTSPPRPGPKSREKRSGCASVSDWFKVLCLETL